MAGCDIGRMDLALPIWVVENNAYYKERCHPNKNFIKRKILDPELWPAYARVREYVRACAC